MRTLYRHGRIHSPTEPFATAMVVDGATIAWLGSADAGAQVDADVTVELEDALVTPAFVDAHVHMTATGLTLTGLDLSAARTLGEALDLVERASRAGRGRPVLGTGWDDSAWPEHRAPTATELDRAGYGGVVYLARSAGSYVPSAVVSSSLAAAVPDLLGMAGAGPDGLVSGDAHHAARAAAFSTLSSGQLRDVQRAALSRAGELGIGCVHEMAGPEVSSAEDLRSLLALAVAEATPQVFGYWGELNGVDTALELGAIGAGGDLCCDGWLGSHTAALREPYTDRPETSGQLRFSVDQLSEHLLRCAQVGLQAGFHAIGDAAIEQILDAVDLASHRVGRLAGAGHRVEHAEMVGDPSRFAAAGLTASVQPGFDAAWGGPLGMYAQRLGVGRASGLNRFAELAAAGVPLAFGSDSPVTPMNPWAAIRAAAYPSQPGAAVSPRSAFAAHTRGGWRAAGRAGEGVIATGATATFAVWQAGELAVDSPDQRVTRWSTDARSGVPGLPDLTPGHDLPICLRTVVAGRTVFQRELES